MKYRILSVCGTGIATSTVATEKTKELLKRRGLDVEIIECKVLEVSNKILIFKPHVIVHTTPVSDEVTNGIKKFSGLAFLTGVGMDKIADDIAEYLRSLE
ncbi:PTS sugar transporter subunit IIB [Clostridium oceanicum]|uniref:PTS sugar transporter subunit IIB n=1 Tax=Clostridium oceanicum TaxID=1543 RepID=A0ABP3UE61_9CLOT